MSLDLSKLVDLASTLFPMLDQVEEVFDVLAQSFADAGQDELKVQIAALRLRNDSARARRQAKLEAAARS